MRKNIFYDTSIPLFLCLYRNIKVVNKMNYGPNKEERVENDYLN